MTKSKKSADRIIFVFLLVFAVVMMYPLFFILNNSFKGKFFISSDPFSFPNSETFVGIKNYVTGIEKTGIINAAGWSFFITIVSVALIILFTSMTAYYITRVKSKVTSALYYMFVFSMIVPFQMVMFTMASLADKFGLKNPVGMCILYLGFGAGLSVFMFAGFVKSIPLEIEEAAMIDGCSPLQIYFKIVLPILKPTMISVGVLETMWVWNDYLLPTLVLDIKKYRTIPMLIQYFRGSYGRVEMGPMMACIVMTVLPVVIIYLLGQKHIIKGVLAGAVKG